MKLDTVLKKLADLAETTAVKANGTFKKIAASVMAVA